MTDHDTSPLSTALHERVRDEDPDLDQLIRVSTRTGTRLRRRRTIGISLAGAAAGVAVIGIVGAALGGAGGTTGSEPGVASEPTAAASSAVSTPTYSIPTGQDLPVHVDPALTGWEFGTAGDDKFPATKGDYFVSVNVRSMDEYDDWSGGDPDRPDNGVVHVGDNYFVTVQASPDVPPVVKGELIDALRYDPAWDRTGAQ